MSGGTVVAGAGPLRRDAGDAGDAGRARRVAIFRSGWRADVLVRTSALWSDVQLIVACARPGPDRFLAERVAAEIRMHLDTVRAVASDRLPLLRRSGAIAACYERLHEAVALRGAILPPAQLEAALPNLVSKARHLLHADDPRRQSIESLLVTPPGGAPVFHPERRARFVEGLRRTYGIADLTHGQVRRLRNNLVAAMVVLVVVVVSSALAGYLAPDALPLCAVGRSDADPPATVVACPTQEQGLPDQTTGPEPQPDDFANPWDVTFVALFGLMGATLSSAFAVVRSRPRTASPYNLPLYYFLLKLPAGSLTAIVGLFLVNGAFIPGLSALQTQAQMLGYAVLFGAAQQLFTRWIDKQAEELLDALPGRGSAPTAADGSQDPGHKPGARTP